MLSARLCAVITLTCCSVQSAKVISNVNLPGTPLPNAPLHPFAVAQPLLSSFPRPPEACTKNLIKHSFANSFGEPAITQYTPPPEKDCGKVGSWARVVLTFTGSSNGTQFDRLSSVYLQGVEIWRTSTPEPTPLGIFWSTEKDVSRYASLLAKPGTLELDLANLLDASMGLTGIYDVSLDVTYVPSSKSHRPGVAADLVIPLTNKSPNSTTAFSIPPGGVTLTKFPSNAAKAVVEVYASGDSLEEFWYGNVPDEFFPRLPAWNAPDGQANPHGPFREVQLLIDNTLAGVVFPYPVIYTGEFLPSIWRPMVSFGAFNSPTYEIDITHFIPQLSHSKIHNFTLAVVGQEKNHTINSDWIVSGVSKIFLDSSDLPTQGNITKYEVSPFAQSAVKGSAMGPAPDIYVTTTASRRIAIEGEVRTGSGMTIHSTWTQQLKFFNSEQYVALRRNISTQTVEQLSYGCTSAFHNGAQVIEDCFHYPLSLLLTYQVFGGENQPSNVIFYDYGVHLNHTFQRQFKGIDSTPKQSIVATQSRKGTQTSHVPQVTIRTGQASEMFRYGDSDGKSYFRDVAVATFANNTAGQIITLSSLISDEAGGSLNY